MRWRSADERAFSTERGITTGATRGEGEYERPKADAMAMRPLCKASLEKTRYIVPFGGHRWEVDQFMGRLSGLVIAEIELNSENEPFTRPPFIGEDVTGDPKYYNSNLSKA